MQRTGRPWIVMACYSVGVTYVGLDVMSRVANVLTRICEEPSRLWTLACRCNFYVEEVTAKIKELRSLVAKDKSDKIGDGKKKAQRAGTGQDTEPAAEEGRAGGLEDAEKHVRFELPEAFQVDFTRDEDLKDVVGGPDVEWAQDVYKPKYTHGGEDGVSAPEEAKRLVTQAQQLAASPTLTQLEGASDDLYAWAASRVARQPDLDLVSLMTEMATYGMGELAKEATEYLELADTKAGEATRITVKDTMWVADQPGQGSVQIDGRTWRLWDFGEDVEMTEELASLLKLAQPEVERRQCVTMTIAAAVEWRRRGRRPHPDEVRQKAQELRLEQTRLAKEAETLIGGPEEFVAPIEHELRIYIHGPGHPGAREGFQRISCLPGGGSPGSSVGGSAS